MRTLKIEIEPELHRRLKVKAAEEGVLLKDLTGALLDKGLDRMDSGEVALSQEEPKTEEVGA